MSRAASSGKKLVTSVGGTRLVRAAGLAVVWGLAAGILAAQQPESPFSVSTDLVVVPVVVENAKGEAITTLTAADFSVTEDGRPVAIETFRAPTHVRARDAGDGDRFIVIALDNINTPAEIAWRVKDIAKRFVDKAGPSDDVSVITLANGRAASGTGTTAARIAIDRFAPMMLSARTRAQLIADGLESLASLTEQIAKSPHRRKILTIIGASAMFDPSDPSAFDGVPPNVAAQWEYAVRTAGRANISAYLIDPHGPLPAASASEFGAPGASPQRPSFIYPPGYMSDAFTTRTGGLSWVNTNNYKGAIDRIWRDAAAYYLIGYRTPLNDRRLHDIEVTVKGDGLRVRARRTRG